MIAAVSWIPKGASKSVPEEAQLPSKEEIEELIKNGAIENERLVCGYEICCFVVVVGFVVSIEIEGRG